MYTQIASTSQMENPLMFLWSWLLGTSDIHQFQMFENGQL